MSKMSGVWAAPSGGEISVFWLGGLEGRRGCKRAAGDEGGRRKRRKSKLNLYCSSDSKSL